MTDIRWIQNVDGEWHLKNLEYVSISRADKIEDKLDMLKEAINYLLEIYQEGK